MSPQIFSDCEGLAACFGKLERKISVSKKTSLLPLRASHFKAWGRGVQWLVMMPYNNKVSSGLNSDVLIYVEFACSDSLWVPWSTSLSGWLIAISVCEWFICLLNDSLGRLKPPWTPKERIITDNLRIYDLKTIAFFKAIKCTLTNTTVNL